MGMKHRKCQGRDILPIVLCCHDLENYWDTFEILKGDITYHYSEITGINYICFGQMRFMANLLK